MSCLIGIADSRVAKEQEITWDTNKTGGQVLLPPEVKSVLEPACVLCGRRLLLIVQLYCPLQYSPYHRVMYVFACSNPQCWNKCASWTVYRCQILDNSSAHTSNTPSRHIGQDSKVATDEWGVGDTGDSWGAEGADDWGDEDKSWGMDGADEWGTVGNDECKEERTIEDPSSEVEFSKGIDDKCDGSIQDNHVDYKDTGICQKSDWQDASHTDHKQDVTVDLGMQQMNIHDPESDNNDSHVIPEDSQNISIDKTVLKEICEVSDSSGSHSTIVSYYLNVFEEPANQEDDSYHVIKLLKEYEKKEGHRVCDTESMPGSSGGGKSEGYERTNVRHKDLTFHKFLKRVSLCPQQCIRYECSGTPLYIKELPTAECPTRCRHCGGETVFEFQLMPALVNYLKAAETTGVAVEFGTVLVFTCKQSCWEEGDAIKTEQIIVQPDPDQHFFR